MPDINQYLDNINNAVLGEEVRGSIHDAIEAINDATIEGIEQASARVGTPVPVSTAASMEDTTKIYLYTGEETGYTAGHWYYYDGSAWTDGGAYNSPEYDYDRLYNKPAIVEISSDEPEDSRTNIWFDPDGEEVEIPTMEEFEDALGQISDLQNELSYTYDEALTLDDADSYQNVRIMASNGSVVSSGSWRTWWFSNVEADKILVSCYSGAVSARENAISFYNSSTPSAETYISGVPLMAGNNEYSARIPSNCKLIAISNRTESLDSPTGSVISSLSRNNKRRIVDLETNIIKDYVVGLTEADKTAHKWISAIDGSITNGSSYTAYYYKNIGYYKVECTVLLLTDNAAIAFYSSETPSADSFISAVPCSVNGSIRTYSANVPSNCKLIIVNNRTSAYATPQVSLSIDPDDGQKFGIDAYKNTSSMLEYMASEKIKQFSKACVIDLHQGYTLDGEKNNTLGAFYDAYLNGATSIEADARESSDGVWMCVHDTTITGINEDTQESVTYTVAETPSTTLMKVILKSDSKYGVQKMPTIEEVFTLAYKTGLIVNLDMKDIRNNTSDGARIGGELAALAHENGMAGRVIYAPNGGGIDTVNAVLSRDPDARFIDTAGRWRAMGISSIDNYQNRIIAYIAYPDFSLSTLAVVRTLGCLLALSGINATNFNEMIQYHPNLLMFVDNANFKEIIETYLQALPQ